MWPLRIDGCAYAAGATFDEAGRQVLDPGATVAVVLDDTGVVLVGLSGIALQIEWESVAGIDVRGPAAVGGGRLRRMLVPRDWCYVAVRLHDGEEVLVKVFGQDADTVDALVEEALAESASDDS